MKLVIIGAGGHAKVVADTAQLSGWQVLGFADDDVKANLFGLPHLGEPSDLKLPKDVQVIIAIGSNRIRQKLALAFSNRFTWATVIHPKAFISSHATVQMGTVIFAGAVIQADTIIGQHCIINSSASIDHDCKIADYCHVAPNATLTGGINLETGVFIGAGAVIAPSKQIGAWSTLGAGGVAVKNLQSNETFTGVPAKKLISS
jgi:sugar O-acyltransferase (sialic acid O-acetyltransferase NeuD family)